MTTLLIFVIALSFAFTGNAWKTSFRSARQPMWHSRDTTRKIAACLLLPALIFGGSDVSLAKGGPEGSKTSRKFENCVSQCVFDETKPPPVGSGVDRLEAVDQKTAIRLCRKKCAKTKAQLMMGNPKDKAAMGVATGGEAGANVAE